MTDVATIMTDVPLICDAEEASGIALYLQLREKARASMVELLESLVDLDPEAVGIALAEKRLTETRHNVREAWVALASPHSALSARTTSR